MYMKKSKMLILHSETAEKKFCYKNRITSELTQCQCPDLKWKKKEVNNGEIF